MSDGVESLKIVALCVAAAVVFGVVHDMVTARVCLEYFTVGHPDVAGHDPTGIALHWGVVATWWVGLPLGIALAIASRAGHRTPATAREALPRVAKMISILFVLAMCAGSTGYVLAEMGSVWLVGSLRDRIPPEHHHAFLFDAWAHTTSYVAGALGGLIVSVVTFRARPLRSEAVDAERRSLAA